MSITYVALKIKSLMKDDLVFIGICAILAAFFAVGVHILQAGQMSAASGEGEAGIGLFYDETLPPGGKIYASTKNRTYFYPWCRGAVTTKPADLRIFGTKEAASSAGFTPSKQCAGIGPK